MKLLRYKRQGKTIHLYPKEINSEALQEIRIKYRLQAIDLENETMENSKKSNINFESAIPPNETLLINYLPGVDISYRKLTRNGLKIN
ncbi:hypothetical protein [Flavobacterium sp. FlaQc-47]|uniref:hypothetical protein n=1 Tax=Flavobacterium sp. FlaQc-47 TaxID=3374180 RepID=UPI00375676E6